MFEVSPLLRRVVLEIPIENGFNGLSSNNYYNIYYTYAVWLSLL